MPPTPPPTPLFSKPVIDPLNTVAWFVMDAMWLGRVPVAAYAAMALAVGTGLLLVVLGRRAGRGELLADVGLNCWLVMNAVWLLHDLNGRETPREFALVMGLLGGGFLLAAAWHSQDLRRVRIARRR